MRLTLVIYSLSAGGAERVLSILANYWAKKGWQITLLTMDDGKKLFYELHPAITHRPLAVEGKSSNLFWGLVNNLKRIWVIRKALKASAPQIVISFMKRTNVLVFFATLNFKPPLFVCEHSDPHYSRTSGIWDLLRNLTYLGATRLIVLTQTARSYFSSAIQRHTIVIPNPVLPPENNDWTNGKRDFKTLLAMGRLNKVKGFDLLLKAFAKIAPKHPDWSLVIWGEGPQRASLEKLRDELGLKTRVKFPGTTKQPGEKMRESDIFVLSSRSEAFPMALLEAMARGLPAISFDCPSGPREIIRDGLDGILVPPEDVDAFAHTLDRLMSDENERNRLSLRALEVNERFQLEKVMGMWEDILKSSLRN
ncbi:MAG: amylovoran biosynthesis protein AmsD [Nitrospinaceae bacterium]|nr:MAG: amylovoran biosynthesis protein AmsD [Nitrospinaceae bacterium]